MNGGILVSAVLFLFLSFLLCTYLASQWREKKRGAGMHQPPVSIIIPMYNEEKTIESSLRSIFESSYPAEKLQVIVVDDCSSDNTLGVVRDLQTKFRWKMMILPVPHAGKAMALNAGVEKARNELVLTLDADVCVGKNTICDLVENHSDPLVAATNCVARVHFPRTFLECYQAIEYSLNNLIRISFSRVFGNSIWFFGACACYKKSILTKLGGFKRDTLTEDMDICLEMYKAGFRIVTVPSAMIETEACRSIKELALQRMRWYYGALQALHKNNHILRSQWTAPPVMFLYFNQWWWTFFAFISFPLFVYQIQFWLPPLSEILWVILYFLRWFSFAGPLYVLWKIPEWGINFANIFGVTSGIITMFLSLAALRMGSVKIGPKIFLALFLYFPYTILLNFIVVMGVVRYRFLGKKKYFID